MIQNSPDLINARDQDGIAPLHIAARNGYLAAARLLLDHGADINATDKEGEHAASYRRR